MRCWKRSFWLNIDPSILPTAQQKGVTVRSINGHAVAQHYTKTKVRRAAATLLRAIRDASGNEPMGGDEHADWFLSVVFVYPLPKGYPKRRFGTYKRTRPDGDNLLKMVQDVITQSGLYWNDDAQVQIDNVIRRYQTSGEQPRILISIKQHKEANF